MQPRVVFTSQGESRRLVGVFLLRTPVWCGQCYGQIEDAEVAVLAEPVDWTPTSSDTYVHRTCLQQYVVQWGGREAAREGGGDGL